MYEELIKQLREAPNDWYDADLHYEAADAIEKLVAMMRTDKEFLEQYGGETGIKNLNEFAGKYWDTLAKIPRWIPVMEKLPEKNIEVLIFAEGKIDGFLGDTAIAISKRYDLKIFTDYEGVEVWQSPWQYFLTDYEITHWMPLPTPPEPKKEI